MSTFTRVPNLRVEKECHPEQREGSFTLIDGILSHMEKISHFVRYDTLPVINDNNITWILRRPLNGRKALLVNSHILGQNEAI